MDKIEHLFLMISFSNLQINRIGIKSDQFDFWPDWTICFGVNYTRMPKTFPIDL